MTSLLYGTLRKHNASATTDNGAESATVVEKNHNSEKPA